MMPFKIKIMRSLPLFSLNFAVYDPKTPQNALRASFLSTFSTTAEQVSETGIFNLFQIVVDTIVFPNIASVGNQTHPPLCRKVVGKKRKSTCNNPERQVKVDSFRSLFLDLRIAGKSEEISL